LNVERLNVEGENLQLETFKPSTEFGWYRGEDSSSLMWMRSLFVLSDDGQWTLDDFMVYRQPSMVKFERRLA
jgi:hypothetical protein